MNSSFMKNVFIFDIFYHFPQFEQSKSEVWKGKNLCVGELIDSLNILLWNRWWILRKTSQYDFWIRIRVTFKFDGIIPVLSLAHDNHAYYTETSIYTEMYIFTDILKKNSGPYSSRKTYMNYGKYRLFQLFLWVIVYDQ